MGGNRTAKATPGATKQPAAEVGSPQPASTATGGPSPILAPDVDPALLRYADRSAQSTLRNALTAEKVFYVDGGRYASAEEMQMSGIEPSLVFISSEPEPGTEQVRVTLLPGNRGLCLTVRSRTGWYWAIGELLPEAQPPTGFVDSELYHFGAPLDPLSVCSVSTIRSGSQDGFPPGAA